MLGSISKAEAEAQKAAEQVAETLARVKARDIKPEPKQEDSSDPAPSDHSEKLQNACLLVLTFGNFFTPVMTQSYTPLLPLLVHDELDQDVSMVGGVFAALTFASLISFAAMASLLARFSPRQVLLGNYVVRTFSGMVHVAGCSLRSLPLLIASRLMYGITLNSFAIGQPWVGVHIKDPTVKQTSIAKLQAAVAIGILTGPSVGSAMGTLASVPIQAYAMPGWLSILGSIGLYLLTAHAFKDHQVLPSAPKPTADGAGDNVPKEVQTIAMAINVNQFFMALGGMAGFEALMSLMVKDSYSWGIDQQFARMWLPFAIGTGMVTLNTPFLLSRFNAARIALFCMLIFNVSLIGIHFSDLGTATSLWRFYVAMVGLFFGGLAYVLHLSILTIRVPPAYQVKYGSMAQSLGQAGRAVGPILATQWYGLLTRAFSVAAGTSAGFSFLWITSFISIGFPAMFFSQLYGSPSDQSPYEKAQAKEKGAMV